MSEKRFFTKINKNGRNVIIDKECNIELIDLTLACDVLNRLDLKLKHYNEVNGEQQATINKLKSDIEETEISIKLFEDDVDRLSKENEQLKEKVIILEKLISDVETSEGMSIDNLIDTEMVGDE